MGSGQYYDPHTGRFLTRGVNSQQTNPYVPWAADPSGMLFAPLALFSMVYGRRKKQAAKWEILLLVLLMGGSHALGLTACSGGPSATPTVVQTPNTPVPSSTVTITGTPTATSTPTVTSTPNETPTITCTIASMSTQKGPFRSFRNGHYEWKEAVKFARLNKNPEEFRINGMEEGTEREIYDNNCANFVSYALEAGGLNIVENTWYPSINSDKWVGSDELFDFLKDNGFHNNEADIFINTVNLVITDSNFIKNPQTCFPFRVHNNYINSEIQALDESQPTWPEYLERIQNTRPGDLVFYKDQTGIWSHVGIITTNFLPPTEYKFDIRDIRKLFLDFQYGNEPEPRMIDHSGITSGGELPRSIGDSSSFDNFSIVILHQP